jgi:hypothetical protein
LKKLQDKFLGYGQVSLSFWNHGRVYSWIQNLRW